MKLEMLQKLYAVTESLRDRRSLVDYCDMKLAFFRENYGIPWHRADRIGLAGLGRALENEDLRSGAERVNCSLWTAKKYIDVGPRG